MDPHALFCERKPFLVIAKKDKDRNYLKVNDGSSLSLSSFDVAGNNPKMESKLLFTVKEMSGDPVIQSSFQYS